MHEPMTAGPTTLSPAAERAVKRWKLGHHMFHLHLTAMNSLLKRAHAHLEGSRWAELTSVLEHLRALYDGATATMHYTADFNPGQYTCLIRPSMAPPFLSPGFSGTLNIEHRMMIDSLRGLRRSFRAIERVTPLPPVLTRSAEELWRSQSRNRKDHMYICDQFVPDGASLLDEFFKNRGRAQDANAAVHADDKETAQ
jgi:hypothetical protein